MAHILLWLALGTKQRAAADLRRKNVFLFLLEWQKQSSQKAMENNNTQREGEGLEGGRVRGRECRVNKKRNATLKKRQAA